MAESSLSCPASGLRVSPSERTLDLWVFDSLALLSGSGHSCHWSAPQVALTCVIVSAHTAAALGWHSRGALGNGALRDLWATGLDRSPKGIVSVMALAGLFVLGDRVRRPSRSWRGHTWLGGDRLLAARLGHAAV